MLYEVCFNARGGQGAVIAARLLVHAACLSGLWGQAFPLFGGERRGAPVFSYARISDKPIRLRSQIREPNALLVFDRSLMEGSIKVKENGVVLVNSPSRPQVGHAKVYWLDATSIAKKHNLVIAGWPAVNSAMLGAFAKVTGIVAINDLVKAIKSVWTG
ncbi:MAG: 2-oxoacid:acceptor oxidoreductase family protein, partial [Thermofilaceae archaeon]